MDYGEFRFARCRLCGDAVNNPRLLTCWHVFCQDCLIGYNTEKEQVKCPVCKEVTPLPPEGIPGLQHKARGFLFRIGSQSPKIAEFTNTIYLRHFCPARAKQVQSHRKCFVPATKRCVECDEYLCSLCSSNHLLEMHKAPPTVCGRHNKAEDFYCEDCNVVTCSRCAGTIHIHHDTCEMEEVAAGFREVMDIWLDQWRQGRWQVCSATYFT
ncbi:E3 ubiquitin-protein ligase TRIM56-like [Branchiostoma lanceolatum]|uniref:E3 ubiquitin-protein ligase TRIM56-like n=1 Tax=Branchiostoma lanceolatum TaxID=7740 RepID=UPI003456C662